MGIGKIVFLVVIAAGVVYLVLLFAKGAGPDSSWRLGRHDPLRNLLFHRDGTWRRFGKLGVLLAIVALVLVAFFGV
jgi:hypothetical protein